MNIINNKWMFVHVPKTGGTTVSKVLTDNIRRGELISLGVHTPRSSTELSYRGTRINGCEYQDVVTIARHPLPRLVSLYTHMLRMFDVKTKTNRCRVCGAPDCTKHTPPDIYTYLTPERCNGFMRIVTCGGILPSNLKILQFDSLEDDLRKFCRDELDLHLGSIPHLNSKPTKFTELGEKYVNDDRVIELVRKYTKDECSYFGYTF